MKAGVLVKVAREVLDLVVDTGLIDANGDFVTPTPDQDVKLAAGVEAILKANGVDIPNRVDKIIQLIPLVLQIVQN